MTKQARPLGSPCLPACSAYRSRAPLQGADFDGKDIRLKYDKDTVKDAPRIDKDQHLDLDEQRDLPPLRLRQCGERVTQAYLDVPDWAGKERSRRGAADAGDKEHAMTLSEERLKAGKERVEVGRARLRKYTTTHTEKVDVPVTKEKLVVERTPPPVTPRKPRSGTPVKRSRRSRCVRNAPSSRRRRCRSRTCGSARSE